ncbi:hypothetical protein [Streptomyces sp. NPDC052701]|uniref:hypothetical protein n=1 Tax=Streptomyces sp. NPDC052701 TaxID=3155533 RepID=UPI00343A804A
MSDASTHQSRTADVQEAAAGHGRHRGPASARDGETAPRGRHRKPAQENGRSGTAA